MEIGEIIVATIDIRIGVVTDMIERLIVAGIVMTGMQIRVVVPIRVTTDATLTLRTAAETVPVNASAPPHLTAPVAKQVNEEDIKTSSHQDYANNFNTRSRFTIYGVTYIQGQVSSFGFALETRQHYIQASF